MCYYGSVYIIIYFNIFLILVQSLSGNINDDAYLFISINFLVLWQYPGPGTDNKHVSWANKFNYIILKFKEL